MAALPEWCQRTLDRQLAMNSQTWAALQRHGVDEATPISLDFFYDAPDEDGAQSLVALLRDSTDYDVNAQSQKTGVLSKRTWTVAGTTRPTPLSLDTLNQWIRWMVLAGAQYGECRFDGWGAKVP